MGYIGTSTLYALSRLVLMTELRCLESVPSLVAVQYKVFLVQAAPVMGECLPQLLVCACYKCKELTEIDFFKRTPRSVNIISLEARGIIVVNCEQS